MPETLAARFEAERPRLRALARRMLGSAAEAEDAVQESWLRLAAASGIDNVAAWLTTVVSRICLDLLRARRETPFEQVPDHGVAGPEEDVALADEVGRALLVVLATLAPAERVAFVLHDLFSVPFDTVGPILDRAPATAKKLASRARLRVRGTPVSGSELTQHREVVEAFLAAARGGDLAALLELLAPDVVRHADVAALAPGAATVLRGADAVARGTTTFAGRARHAEPALVDGTAGLVFALYGRLTGVLKVTVTDGHVAAYEVIADPDRLAKVEVAVLP